MKNTIPKKIPVLFSRPKKIPSSFIDPKNPFWPKCQTQKNPSHPPPPPSLKYVSGVPGREYILTDDDVISTMY